MVWRTGAGDPARTLELLWRQWPGDPARSDRPRRGPLRGLSVDQIVESAISLADADGLEAVTMRRVAETLGVAPMTLYTYVPGKAELVDLMLDSLYGQVARDYPALSLRQSWRSRLQTIAHHNRALFRRHPWAAAVSTVRPPLGPGLMAKYDRELRALDGLGLQDVQIDAALTFLLGFVRWSALAEIEGQLAARDSQMNDTQWWEANAPLLARVLDATAYPTAARVGTAAGAAYGAAYNPDYAYEFGLQRALDGLEAIVPMKPRARQ